jgi:hypothetical protein
MLVCVLSVLDEWLPRFNPRGLASAAGSAGALPTGLIDIVVTWDGTDFFDMAGGSRTLGYIRHSAVGTNAVCRQDKEEGVSG